MIILLHVVIALASIITAAYAYMRPSQKSLFTSYALIAATVGSGFYLVVQAPAHMIEACLMGVGYLAIVTVATAAARIKLARIENTFVHTR